MYQVHQEGQAIVRKSIRNHAATTSVAPRSPCCLRIAVWNEIPAGSLYAIETGPATAPRTREPPSGRRLSSQQRNLAISSSLVNELTLYTIKSSDESRQLQKFRIKTREPGSRTRETRL